MRITARTYFFSLPETFYHTLPHCICTCEIPKKMVVSNLPVPVSSLLWFWKQACWCSLQDLPQPSQSSRKPPFSLKKTQVNLCFVFTRDVGITAVSCSVLVCHCRHRVLPGTKGRRLILNSPDQTPRELSGFWVSHLNIWKSHHGKLKRLQIIKYTVCTLDIRYMYDTKVHWTFEDPLHMPLAIVLPRFPFVQQLLHLLSNLAQKLLNLPCWTHLARECFARVRICFGTYQWYVLQHQSPLWQPFPWCKPPVCPETVVGFQINMNNF